MGFVARFGFSEPVPSRVYVGEYGLRLFGASYSGAVRAARSYAVSVLSRSGGERLRTKAYGFGVVWGDIASGQRAIDLFGFEDVSPIDWPGNPQISAWVFKNGVYVSADTEPITCCKSVLLLAEEERHRRTLRNLDEFVSRRPSIPKDLGELIVDE